MGSNPEDELGIVLSTPDLTIKHVHHTQLILKILEDFDFFSSNFRTRLGRIAKTTSDSVLEPTKMIQNDMLRAYIRHIFEKNLKIDN